jgi:hypothetical protein
MYVSIHEVGAFMFLELILQKTEEETIATQRKHARQQIVPYSLRSEPQALPKRDLFSIVRSSVQSRLFSKRSSAERDLYQFVIW